MIDFDNESRILEVYRSVPIHSVKFMGHKLPCLWIYLVTKLSIFWRTWTDTSAKNAPPPDFHNNRFSMMMEVMRVDDCVDKIKKEKVRNSSARQHDFLLNHYGPDYENMIQGTMWFIPDTRDNERFNFQGYRKTFKRVFEKHSHKSAKYHHNYPKCKKLILFVFDESNPYEQLRIQDLCRANDENQDNILGIVHQMYYDEYFLDIIRKSNANYVIWFGVYKTILMQGIPLPQPSICIFDVKHLPKQGVQYTPQNIRKII